jgi:hypothetical protein
MKDEIDGYKQNSEERKINDKIYYLKNDMETIKTLQIKNTQKQMEVKLTISNTRQNKVKSLIANQQLNSCQHLYNIQQGEYTEGIMGRFNDDLLVMHIEALNDYNKEQMTEKPIKARAVIRKCFDKTGRIFFLFDRVYVDGTINKKDAFNLMYSRANEKIPNLFFYTK